MKNKILTISIIFILLSFIFINNNVFAASYDLSDYKNKVGSNSYLIAYDEIKDTFYLIVSANSGTKYFIGGATTNDNGDKYMVYGVACSGSYGSWQQNQCNYYVYTFDVSTNTFVNKSTYTPSNQFYFSNNLLIIASNTNFYHWENTTPFFQITPVPSKVIMGQMTLAETLEEAQAVKNFQTMMSGIIPYLIALVVGLVAFWKAWQLLLKELRQA